MTSFTAMANFSSKTGHITKALLDMAWRRGKVGIFSIMAASMKDKLITTSPVEMVSTSTLSKTISIVVNGKMM